MATEFVMPKLGLTMEAGTIIEWLAESGAVVAKGESVLVIETDKVETEVESPAAGVLHRASGPGDKFECGEVIGYLLAEGEAAPAGNAAASPVADAAPSIEAPATASPTIPSVAAQLGGRMFVSPNARRRAKELGVSLASVRGTGPGGRVVSEDVEELAARPAPVTAPANTREPSGDDWAPNASSSTPATVAARQLADLLGIDLRVVPAASRDGRRQREDVAAYVRQQLAVRANESRTPALLQTPVEVIPFAGMRGVIADRMYSSLREMAQLTLHLDAPMDAVVADRAGRREHGTAPGFTDYVIAAVARALGEHPIVNSQVTDHGIAVLPEVHIGMAVAVDGGLLVPVIRNADRLGLATLSAETSRLADAARSKRLPLSDLEGGTFSVTALGMFGVDGFTPVINAPNAAILGVGRVRDEVRVVGGAVTTTSVATLSLTWDHRVFDGAPAAAFTARVAELLADPAAFDRTT